MTEDRRDTEQPRHWWGFSFLSRAFRTVFGANHPARRTLTPPGYPLRVTATVTEVAARLDHTCLRLEFSHEGLAQTAALRLAPGVTSYLVGETRPLFINPEQRGFMFGVLTGVYEASAGPAAPLHSPSHDGFPLCVTAHVARIGHYEASSGTAAQLMQGGQRSHIWRTDMTLRFQHAGRSLGCLVELPPGTLEFTQGDDLRLNLTSDAGQFVFADQTGPVRDWSWFDLSDDGSDDPVDTPPRQLH